MTEIPFVKVPVVLLFDKRLHAGAVRVYAVLIDLSDSMGGCAVSQKCLANHLGMGTTTIRRHLKELKGLGYLGIVKHYEQPTGWTLNNTYEKSQKSLDSDIEKN